MHDYIDALNWSHDSRNCERETDEEFTLEMPDGRLVTLPTHWEVCAVCRGNGSHVNPSIDCGGLSADDFADDPEFAESYFNGDYDETCRRCGGRTTVREVDYDALPDEVRKVYDARLEADRCYEAERRAEIAFGC